MRYSRRLYEISADFNAILEQIESADGEVDQTLESELYKLELERDQKLENCCAVVKNYRAEADIYAAEIKRLRAQQTRCEKVAERVEAYIEAHIMPGEKWGSGPHKISWRKSESVELADDVDISEVPDAYKQTVTTLMKAEAKRDLKMGADLWFVKVTEKQNIQVK
jgi:hypothetical protein